MVRHLLLAFDTSAAHCAAALLWSGTNPDGTEESRVASCAEAMAKGQAERLVPMIEAFLALQGVGWPDLDGIAVGVGPGNFTGVRIAVSLARGLSLGLGIPAVGVPAFHEFDEAPRPCWVVVDAPRGQVHAKRMDGAEGPPVTLDAAEATGLDAPVFRVTDRTPEERVRAIARAGRSRIFRHDLPRPAPFYIRPADAAPPSDPPPRILPDAP